LRPIGRERSNARGELSLPALTCRRGFDKHDALARDAPTLSNPVMRALPFQTCRLDKDTAVAINGRVSCASFAAVRQNCWIHNNRSMPLRRKSNIVPISPGPVDGNLLSASTFDHNGRP
jgi:hypothetical protein